MPYVERDAVTGRIKGVYANRQPGIAEELIDKASAEVVNYLAYPSGRRQRTRAAILADLDALPAGRLNVLLAKVAKERAVAAVLADPTIFSRNGEAIPGDEPVP